MPRELCHWSIVEEGKRALPPGFSRRALERFPAASYLGAVAHDAPYYARFGRSPFAAVAEALHGSEGQDTFRPLLSLLPALREREEEPQLRLWSFLLGMLSHIATDATFHPVVYYFTGDYNAPDPRERALSQARHRAFEVYLESWFEEHEPLPASVLIRDYGADVRLCSEFLGTDVLGTNVHGTAPLGKGLGSTAEWEGAFSDLFQIQALARSAVVGPLMRAANALLGGRLKGAEALVRSGRTKPLALFTGEFLYHHPVTGAAETTTISQLKKSAVGLWLTALSHFEHHLHGTAEDLPPLVGPSLNSGLPHTHSTDLRHFAD